jgi:molybdate transport system substrate-binding protein
MTRTLGIAVAVAHSLISICAGMTARAAEMRVLSANGVKAIMVDLVDKFGSATGNKVTLSFAEAGEIKTQIQNGESFDVTALPSTVLDDLARQHKILSGSTVNIAHSSFGMGVRAGAPRPDTSSIDGFRRSLLDTNVIVITDPATGGVSGVHFLSVLQRLGIEDEIKPKLKLNKGSYNAEFVSRGEAQIAVQAEHEIRCVSGIEFVPFPTEFQRTVIFAAAVSANAKEAEAAKSLTKFLTGPEAIAAIKCMEPG